MIVSEVNERSTLKSLSNFILTGEDYSLYDDMNCKNHTERLEKIQSVIEKLTEKYKNENTDDISEKLWDILEEYGKIYFEIGFKSGFKLYNEIISGK